MAYLGQSFDANTVSPDTAYDPLPAGEYLAIITDSEMKPTKNSAGSYLELVLQVIEGNYANRLIWDRLTLVHPNQKTVEIAQRRLSAICHAVGVLQITDSAQVHNRPLSVRLKVVEDAQYGTKNEITGYKPTGNTPSQPAPGAHPAHTLPPQNAHPVANTPAAAPPWASSPTQQPSPQATQAVPPWARK